MFAFYLLLSTYFLKSIITYSKFGNLSPFPTFIKINNGNYLMLPTSKTEMEYFTNKELQHETSSKDDIHICLVLFYKNKRWKKFLERWPNLRGKKVFPCLIFDKNVSNKSEEMNVNNIIDLLSLLHIMSLQEGFEKKFFLMNSILKLSEKMEVDFVIMNHIWKILLENGNQALNENLSIKEIKTDHLYIKILNINPKEYFVKIDKDIQVKIFPKFVNTILVGNFKFHRVFIEKSDLSFKSVILVLRQKSQKLLINYRISYNISSMKRNYKCLKKNIFGGSWEDDRCNTNFNRFNNSIFMTCECSDEGFVSLAEVGRKNLLKKELHNYWGFNFPWDFLDDKTKYLKENSMRYLPLIAVLKIIIIIVSTLTLLVFVYLGFVLCRRNKRIFYAKETIAVVIFLTFLSLSHLLFHLFGYLGLVWIRNKVALWCSFATFSHLNYVLTVCSFQCYVFVVAVSSNSPWLHNIALPILFVASPVAVGVIDGMMTSWINEGCDNLTFNLSKYITFFFIVLPCVIATLLLPIMMIATYAIVHQHSQLLGYIANFLFSSLHLGGGIFLLLANTGVTIELQYYFQFCIVAVMESFFHASLAALLLILSNTNTSLIDKHCTYDIDTKTLSKYFEEPKSVIQLSERPC